MLKLGWYFYILLFSLKCCGDEPFLVSHSSEILKSLPNKLSAQHLFVMCLKNDKSKLEKLFSDWSNKKKLGSGSVLCRFTVSVVKLKPHYTLT